MALTIPAEAYELSAWARRLGVADPLPYLQDISLIDTDTLREVGLRVWGVEYRGGQFGAVLVERAERLRNKLDDVTRAWGNSAAYDAFRNHLAAVREVLSEEAAAPLPVVGRELVAIADELEASWLEIVGWVVAAAGLVVVAAGTGLAVASWWTGAGAVAGVILEVIGLILAAVAGSISYLSSVRPRLATLAAASSRLDGLTTRDSAVDDLRAPDAVAGWEVARDWRPGQDDLRKEGR